MLQASRTIIVARPQAEVFAFFADAENDPQWRPAVKTIKREGPLAVGARYTQRIGGPRGREVPADVEVTAYQPDVLVAFRGITGPVRPEGSYSFATVAGGTSVTFSLAVALSGAKKLLMGKPVQKSIDAEMANLDRAKTLLESRR